MPPLRFAVCLPRKTVPCCSKVAHFSELELRAQVEITAAHRGNRRGGREGGLRGCTWSPRPESNRDLALRRRSFYPLNYGEMEKPLPAASQERYHSISLGIILFLAGRATPLLPVAVMASIIKVKGRWRVQIRRKGHQPITETRPWSKAEAQRWAMEIEIALGKGQSAGAVLARGVTIAQLIDKYRELRDRARPILDTSNEHYMLQHLQEGLGSYEAAAFSTVHIVAWCQMRAEEGAGPYTINMEVSKLGTVYRYGAAALGIALPDVVGSSRPLLWHLGLIGGGGKRDRRPTEDESLRLLAYLLDKHPPRYADAVAFAATSTLRRSEICRILWADVDRKNHVVLVRDRKHPRRKKGNDERVPLTDTAWAILQKQPRDDVRVFPIHPQTLSKYVTEACRALAIPDLHLHDMRHEGTSRLFEQGFSVPEVALFTGHKDWRNLSRYTQLKPEEVRKS